MNFQEVNQIPRKFFKEWVIISRNLPRSLITRKTISGPSVLHAVENPTNPTFSQQSLNYLTVCYGFMGTERIYVPSVVVIRPPVTWLVDENLGCSWDCGSKVPIRSTQIRFCPLVEKWLPSSYSLAFSCSTPSWPPETEMLPTCSTPSWPPETEMVAQQALNAMWPETEMVALQASMCSLWC